MKQAANKKSLKKKNAKSINTSDVHHHYNLRRQQSRNKEVNCLKDDAQGGLKEQGDDVENYIG